MILKLSLDLPEDKHYIPMTRLLGRTLLEYLKAVPQDVGDVETIVGELVSNVIRHAQSTSGRFQMELDYYADRVEISVIDAGQGLTFANVPAVGDLRPDFAGGERLGGFGLPLLDALSDKLQFSRTDPHGTTVRAEKALHYQTQDAAEYAREMNKGGGGHVTVGGG